jgi:hypothetical protein
MDHSFTLFPCTLGNVFGMAILIIPNFCHRKDRVLNNREWTGRSSDTRIFHCLEPHWHEPGRGEELDGLAVSKER